MTKIDYAYNAAERIKVALDDPHLANAHVTAQIATAEATLALVEQQRIANLIAVAVAVREDLVLGGSASALSDWLHEGNGVRGYFSTDEQEGLGL